MDKIDLFQYKSQFHYAFNVNPGNQDSLYFFIIILNGLSGSLDSVVGIATGYGLDDRGVRIRVPEM
jgi:hypothetical protein